VGTKVTMRSRPTTLLPSFLYTY